MITEENTKVVITLTAKDKDNAESKATLEFNPKGKKGLYRVSVNADGTVGFCTGSGLIVEAKQKETFASRVIITLTEDRDFECSDKEFRSVSSLFAIVAEVADGRKITTVEKPVTIAVPNKYIIGKYYVSTRANSNSPWNYMPINNDGTSELLYHDSGRAAMSIPSQFIINTYNTDFQFAIFVKTE